MMSVHLIGVKQGQMHTQGERIVMGLTGQVISTWWLFFGSYVMWDVLKRLNE